MGDSGSFTSLMAMVESHLSKTSLATSQNGDGQAGPSYSLPNICSVRNSNSESVLPPPAIVMQLPRFEVKNSEITEILAHQVKNMLMARENAVNEEKEKQRLVDEMESMQIKDISDDYVVDLSDAIIRPGTSQAQPDEEQQPSELSNSCSMESLFAKIDKFIEKKFENPLDVSLPICKDMSFIMYRKLKKAKCSPFGKVLSARMRPVAAPYLHKKITNPEIIPFDFSTPSPCDINKEKRLHPPPDPYAHMNMVERFMALTKDEEKP